jgi:outer membrane protein OmpA-like peptidoglycan-associated protein
MEALGGARLTTLGLAALFAFASTGCATKKHVAKVVAPVESRVGESEKKLADNTAAIGELESGLSRADERAMDADKKAVAAGQSASQANELAKQAGQSADNARQLAEKGMARANELEQNFDQKIQNLDNYKLVSEESVQFGFGRSALTDESKQKLDEAVKNLDGMRAYVVEVHGFTDRIGNPQYNLELSRKRANEVVRYLTVQHEIPLRRIHVIGVGSAKPVEEGRTRAANAANRRVEIRVFAPEYAVATMGDRGTQQNRQTTPTQPQSNR